MKIIFFKRKKDQHRLTMGLLIAICLFSGIAGFGIILNQPALGWEETASWQVKVYQRADHMMAPNPPWVMINELTMNLNRQESGDYPWCLCVQDKNGYELCPGITGLLIYYSEDLEIMEGYGLNPQNQKVMNIGDFFSLSLYGREFFSPQRKKYHHLIMSVRDRVRVELSDEKGKTVWWKKTVLGG